MDSDLLRRLQLKKADALEQAITQYGAYVLTVIRNRSRGVLTPEDHEEIASDVFLGLWNGAKDITSEQLRPWLGAVARNKTVEAMRRKKVFVPMEDETLITLDQLWEHMYERQRCDAVRKAISCLSEEDCEIFYRFYDLAQTTGEIAAQLHLNAATVRSRLMRGRQTLRRQLMKGGIFHEDDMG